MTLLCRLHLWWHTATVLHLWTCWSLFVHNMSAIVSPSCMRSGECVSQHRFVCAHSGCVLSPSLPLNEESFRTLFKTQITLHFINAIRMYKIKCKLFLLADNFFIWLFSANICCGWVTWYRYLLRFIIFFFLFFFIVGNSNPELFLTLSVVLKRHTLHSASLSVWND